MILSLLLHAQVVGVADTGLDTSSCYLDDRDFPVSSLVHCLHVKQESWKMCPGTEVELRAVGFARFRDCLGVNASLESFCFSSPLSSSS